MARLFAMIGPAVARNSQHHTSSPICQMSSQGKKATPMLSASASAIILQRRCCPRTANLCAGRHITIAHRLMRCAAQWLARAPRHTPAVKLCAGHWPQHTTMTHRPTHCASLWLHGPHGTQTAAKPCAGHCPLPPPYGTQQQLRFMQGTDLSTLP